MSKNFEEEYKALAEADMPDLWGRIEAGLTPRSQKKKNKTLLFLYRYRALAAATVCALIILPAIWLLGENKSKDSTAESVQESGFDTTANAGMDEAASNGAAKVQEAEDWEEAEIDDSPAEAMQNAAADDSTDADAVQNAETDTAAGAETDVRESILADYEVVEEEAKKEKLESAASKVMTDQEGQVFSNIRLRIRKLETTAEGKNLYCQAELMEEMDPNHQAGDVLVLFVAGEGNLKEGDEIQADILYESKQNPEGEEETSGQTAYILYEWDQTD